MVTALKFTTLWAIQQTTNWRYFSYFFPENRFWHFIQIVFNGDILYEEVKSSFLGKVNFLHLKVYANMNPMLPYIR